MTGPTLPRHHPDDEVVHIDLGPRSYDIVVGERVLAEAGRLILPLCAQRRAIIVSDDRVATLYLDSLVASVAAAGIAHQAVVLPQGEQTKDFAHLRQLCERVLSFGIERGTLLIALGGGVIGDLVGFAAGILLRGLDFVQVPTTLLAQVDSSVGGKTGINTRQGKNLVGLFHQPRLVLADVGALKTLDARQMRAGYAEIVKYGLLGDHAFFEWLEAHGARVLSGDPVALRHAIATSCRAKAAIVAEDERERGSRALLNLGHTFGHALEAETGFGDALLHGEGVAIGTVLAFELSARLGLASAADVRRVRRHFTTAGLPVDARFLAGRGTTADRLLAYMRTDKKVRDGRLTFILARGIGQAFVCREVKDDDVRAVLDAWMAERVDDQGGRRVDA